MTNPRHLSIAADPSGEIWIVEWVKRWLGRPGASISAREVREMLDSLSIALDDLAVLCRRTQGARRRLAEAKFDHVEWLTLAIEGEALDAGIFADGARAKITVEVV